VTDIVRHSVLAKSSVKQQHNVYNTFIRHMAANGWNRWIKNKYESKNTFKHTQAHTYKHIMTASDTES